MTTHKARWSFFVKFIFSSLIVIYKPPRDFVTVNAHLSLLLCGGVTKGKYFYGMVHSLTFFQQFTEMSPFRARLYNYSHYRGWFLPGLFSFSFLFFFYPYFSMPFLFFVAHRHKDIIGRLDEDVLLDKERIIVFHVHYFIIYHYNPSTPSF